MNKTINFCGNCPFYHTEYDDFSVGLDVTNTCCLAYYLKQEEYFVSFENSSEYSTIEPIDNTESKFDSPKWCPLKKESEFVFSFKSFSKERIDDINSISEKIEEFDKSLENCDDDYYYTPEFEEKSKKSSELHKKLSELYSNEEPSFDNSYKEEINKSVDEIKEQMKLIEDATNQLQDVLIKLSNDENI